MSQFSVTVLLSFVGATVTVASVTSSASNVFSAQITSSVTFVSVDLST